jgi:NADPH:quinone reductase-like Zn-dependent oxidoreductase
MKAIVYQRYGAPEVLEEQELTKPVPGDNEVLIRSHATTVTSGDWRMRSLDVPPGFGLFARLAFGVRGPRKQILGSELAGEVEAVGQDVTRFGVGDRVFSFDGFGMACYVEYKCVPEDGVLARIPAGLSYEEAAALSFGGTTALHYLRKGKLQRGERVLVNGASGGVGTAAVQLAKHFGAEVTGVCSAANAELVRSLGADHVIDYAEEDFSKSGQTYDVIVDTAGTAPYARCKGSLRKGGRLLLVLAGMSEMLRGPWVSLTSSKKVITGAASERGEDLRLLAELVEAGAYRAVIDRRYPWEQIVEAHHYVDAGHKRGNVVVTLG